jgi:hypothetical protein
MKTLVGITNYSDKFIMIVINGYHWASLQLPAEEPGRGLTNGMFYTYFKTRNAQRGGRSL